MRNSRAVHRIVIRINKPYQLTVLLYYDAFHYERQVVQLRFDLFRINVLSARPQDHRLATATDINTVIGVDRPQVTRTQPAVLRKNLGSRFLVL